MGLMGEAIDWTRKQVVSRVPKADFDQRHPDYIRGSPPNLERWKRANEQPSGVGARYTVHWKIGSVPVGGLIEVVEFDDGRDLAWVGITGVTLRRRIRLRHGAGGPAEG